MQLLCLLIFIGVTKGDDSSGSQALAPACYDSLAIPNSIEYVSQYTLSVQTSYLTSVECMLSSNNYIQSGFSEIDSSSNDIVTNLVEKFKTSFGSMQNMILGLQTDVEKEAEEKINAVASMTVNYYQKKEVTVKKTETKLSEVTEVKQAQSILTARRCESAYIDFMNDVTTAKTMYGSQTSSTDKIDQNQWATQVKQYYDARESIVNNTNVYASIREAFLFGSGINLCDGSANTDQSLLEIYKTDDLSKFFGQTDNNASALLDQTVTHMYKIYKNSLTVIYLKSVVYSQSDLALRTTIWEQVNLVRANYEYMCLNIVLFIQTTQTDAVSSYGADSEEYKKIMITLYTSVNKMLLTVVKSTEVHYQRALNFNPDRSMVKTDFNKYKVDVMEKYYDNILWINANAARYDMRIIDKEHSPYPTSQMCIPQNMYSLVINKLIFQTFICQVNYIDVQIKTAKYDKTTLDSWIYEKISMIELQNSIVFSKCSATINKIFIMNSATYTYILLITDQSTQSTEVQQIIDQSSNDVIGTLSVNTLEITETFNCVNIFVDQNGGKKTSAVVYKPGFKEYTGQNNPPTTTGKTPAPSGDTPAPSGDTPAPSGDTPAPSGKTPTLSENTPAPSGKTPAPSGKTPAPSGDTPAPSGDTPAPSGDTPAPSGKTPTLSENTPAPSGKTPAPSGKTPAPSGDTPASSEKTPAPSGDTPAPSEKTPAPSGKTLAPSGDTPAPSGDTPAPSGKTPTSSGTYNPQPASTTNNNPGTGNNYNNGFASNVEYNYITSGTQVTQTIKFLQDSITTRLNKSLTIVLGETETEYTKILLTSLEISQQIFQFNVDYLYSVASDSINYISEVATPDSEEYLSALVSVFRDIDEKTTILAASMEIPIRRTIYPLTCDEYEYVAQKYEFSAFVIKFYDYFGVKCNEIYSSENDADSFLTNSIAQFNNIYTMVVTAVEKAPDDSYKTFLLCYLQKTIAVYKQTTDCLKEQIVQSKTFISKLGDSSKIAFYQEIQQRVDSINVIYSSILIKSYEYSKSSTTITIFESEFDTVSVQTEIVQSYSVQVEQTQETAVEFEISI